MPSIQLKNIFLDEAEDDKIKKTMMCKTNIKNCLVIYRSSNIFKLKNLTNASMNLIERCFPMMASCNNLIELDFFH